MVSNVRTTDDVIALFRIANFNEADLQICRDSSQNEIFEYNNPCNLRSALKNAIDAYEFQGLYVHPLIMKLEVYFKPDQSEVSKLLIDETNFFESSNQVSESVCVARGEFGHTLISSRDIGPGETVIGLESSMAISIFSAFRDLQFPGKNLVEQGLHPDTAFLLYLVYLRDNQVNLSLEIHRDFFKVQPSNYGTLFELPTDQVESINEPELVADVSTQNDALRQICLSLSPPPKFEDLLWAKSLCTSRAFSLPIEPENEFENSVISTFYPDGKITTLLPFVHFFNHSFKAQCETPIVDKETKKIIVKSLVSINKGDEMFVLYGGMNNKELMLNYGFFVPGNPYDSYTNPRTGRVMRRGAMKEHASPISADSSKTITDLYVQDKERFMNSCS